VTSEYLTALILLWKLNNEVELFSWNIVGDGIIRYLKSGWSMSLMLIFKDLEVHLTVIDIYDNHLSLHNFQVDC